MCLSTNERFNNFIILSTVFTYTHTFRITIIFHRMADEISTSSLIMKYDRICGVIYYVFFYFFITFGGVQFGLFSCNHIKTQMPEYFVSIFVFQSDVVRTIYESFGDTPCRKIIVNINNIVNVRRSSFNNIIFPQHDTRHIILCTRHHHRPQKSTSFNEIF